jgi:hypothetical protein
MTLKYTGVTVASSKEYKEALISYVASQDFDWFITIGMGFCPGDDETLRRLRLIDAIFSKKYLSGRYHKLSPDKRFLTLVAFEGEEASGDRHAHLLVRIPTPLRRGTRAMLISAFPFEFRFLWDKLGFGSTCYDSALAWFCSDRTSEPIKFEHAKLRQKIYTVKSVQCYEKPDSRLEIIPPPKWHKFENENLKVVQNRDKQKRAALGLP